MTHSFPRLAAALILVSAGGASAPRAQTAEPSDAVRVITVTYANGRTTKAPVRDRAWSTWTPFFPRMAGTQPVDHGLALTALQLEYAIDGRDVIVTVALLYGTPHQKRVQVADVRVTGEQPVRVDELAAYGVQPIMFALVSMPRPQLPLPIVTSPSSQLEPVVGVTTSGVPRYQISITNHAQQGVMALAFDAYHGNTKALSGIPHAPGHMPLIAAGGTYVLGMNASPNARSTDSHDGWTALDRIVITSVTWSDGIVEGNERPAIEAQIVSDGTARQLGRALTLMRDAQTAEKLDLLQLRAGIAALSIDDPDAVRAAAADPTRVDPKAARSLTRIGMQDATDTLLKDFDAFLRDPASGEIQARRDWLASAVTKFDGWRTRIVTAPR